MKKLFSLVLAAALVLCVFSGCGAQQSNGEMKKIGILQFAQHPSLDEISAAVQKQLEEQAALKGIDLTISLQNAQGDMSTIQSICQQFVSQKFDLIIAIATPAAQGAAAAIEGTEIPLVFSAVTDPVAAELVTSMNAPGGNITGTSDAIAPEKIFALAKELTPDVKTFGFIYNTSEVNSVSMVKEAKTYLEKEGIATVENAVTTSGEVQLAAQNLLSRCDAVFVPIDNTVANAMSVLADEAIKADKPVYTAADSLVKDGGLATVGVNYTNLGIKTADMALRVLQGEKPAGMPVEILQDSVVVVNPDTAAALGIDVSQYTA